MTFEKAARIPNPQRVREGSIIYGEGYGIAKVRAIRMQNGEVITDIGYGPDFDYGARLNGPTIPRRILTDEYLRDR